MNHAEAEMMALNFIGLDSGVLMEKYGDKTVEEALEEEFGSVGRFIELDKTICVENIQSQGHK